MAAGPLAGGTVTAGGEAPGIGVVKAGIGIKDVQVFGGGIEARGVGQGKGEVVGNTLGMSIVERSGGTEQYYRIAELPQRR